jgi:hypothetical protein
MIETQSFLEKEINSSKRWIVHDICSIGREHMPLKLLFGKNEFFKYPPFIAFELFVHLTEELIGRYIFFKNSLEYYDSFRVL